MNQDLHSLIFYGQVQTSVLENVNFTNHIICKTTETNLAVIEYKTVSRGYLFRNIVSHRGE